MAGRYIAQTSAGLVDEVSVAGPNDVIPPGGVDVTALTPRPARGWSVNGGTFAPPPSVLPTAQLLAYAQAKLAAVKAAGLTVHLGTADAPLDVLADTSADGKSDLSGILQGYALGTMTGNFIWYQTGGSVSLTQAQLQDVAAAVATFTAAAFATWQEVVDAIETDPPAITTPSQIDAAAWPANS